MYVANSGEIKIIICTKCSSRVTKAREAKPWINTHFTGYANRCVCVCILCRHKINGIQDSFWAMHENIYSIQILRGWAVLDSRTSSSVSSSFWISMDGDGSDLISIFFHRFFLQYRAPSIHTFTFYSGNLIQSVKLQELLSFTGILEVHATESIYCVYICLVHI